MCARATTTETKTTEQPSTQRLPCGPQRLGTPDGDEHPSLCHLRGLPAPLGSGPAGPHGMPPRVCSPARRTAASHPAGCTPVSGSSATMNKAPVNIRARDSGWTEAPVSSGSVTGLGKQDKQQRDYLVMLLPKVLGDVTCTETRREGLGH